MQPEITKIREETIEKILAKQDGSFRWGFDEKQACERPEYLYYSPNFKSTLWTLVLLADLQAPVDSPQIKSSIQLIHEHFYALEHGIFKLPSMSHFPIPCLNGNMIYLHQYFGTNNSVLLEKTIAFFAAHQRFDDGDFKTPKTYPYFSNTSCYGKHTCYWGVIKLLKGISFIPKDQRSKDAQRLIEDCIEYVLHHEVCFSSNHKERLLNPDIAKLAFPNFYKSDVLEILWLLAREEVRDSRISRALALLRSRQQADGSWQLEKRLNTIVSMGEKGSANPFISARANEVLDYYQR